MLVGHNHSRRSWAEEQWDRFELLRHTQPAAHNPELAGRNCTTAVQACMTWNRPS